MSGTEQLDGTPEAAGPVDQTPLDRRLWEAEEEIVELRSRLAEQTERERILELEIGAVRKDLEVKVTYAEALERAADERQGYVAWLQHHYDAERQRADQASAELQAERSRLFYRAAQPLIRLLRGRGRPA
jgi:hypothetical protein